MQEKFNMTKPLVFTGNRFDRVSHLRSNPEWLSKKLADPSTRFMPMHKLKALIEVGGEPCIDWRGLSDVREYIDAGAPMVLLGVADLPPICN